MVNEVTVYPPSACHVCGRPAVWFAKPDGSRVYSLRSDERGLDVSEVARSLGGGGHPRAAGFRAQGG